MSSPQSTPAQSPESIPASVSVWPHGPDDARPYDASGYCDRCVAFDALTTVTVDDGTTMAVCGDCLAELAAPAPIPPCPYCGGEVAADDDMLVCQTRPGVGGNCPGAWATVDALAREAAELAATRATYYDGQGHCYATMQRIARERLTAPALLRQQAADMAEIGAGR